MTNGQYNRHLLYYTRHATKEKDKKKTTCQKKRHPKKTKTQQDQSTHNTIHQSKNNKYTYVTTFDFLEMSTVVRKNRTPIEAPLEIGFVATGQNVVDVLQQGHTLPVHPFAEKLPNQRLNADHQYREAFVPFDVQVRGLLLAQEDLGLTHRPLALLQVPGLGQLGTQERCAGLRRHRVEHLEDFAEGVKVEPDGKAHLRCGLVCCG
jgi:hypothetical protein